MMITPPPVTSLTGIGGDDHHADRAQRSVFDGEYCVHGLAVLANPEIVPLPVFGLTMRFWGVVAMRGGMAVPRPDMTDTAQRDLSKRDE